MQALVRTTLQVLARTGGRLGELHARPWLVEQAHQDADSISCETMS